MAWERRTKLHSFQSPLRGIVVSESKVGTARLMYASRESTADRQWISILERYFLEKTTLLFLHGDVYTQCYDW